MIKKYKFSFVTNTLTKRDTFRSLLDIILGRKNLRFSQFKTQWSTFLSVPEEQLFFFGSGRMGVYTFLKSIDLKSNEEVLVTGYTCVVLTNAVKFAGCNISYADINEATLNLNTEELLKKITSLTKVLIVPHNFGLVYQDIQHIKEIHPSLIVIEDVAHTLGSKDQSGKPCGTIGDVSFFSMEFSKPITTGIGGVFVINNSNLLPPFQSLYEQTKSASRFKTFRIGLTLTCFSFSLWKASNFLYLSFFFVLKYTGLLHKTSHKEIDGIMPDNYAYKLPSSLAVFGYYQMLFIEDANIKKQQICGQFYNYFKDFKDLDLFHNANDILVRFPIVFKAHVTQETIAKIKHEARSKGYEFGDWFNDVVHPKGSYRFGYIEGDCPAGEQISRSIINFPVNINLQLSVSELEELKAIFTSNGIK